MTEQLTDLEKDFLKELIRVKHLVLRTQKRIKQLDKENKLN